MTRIVILLHYVYETVRSLDYSRTKAAVKPLWRRLFSWKKIQENSKNNYLKKSFFLVGNFWAQPRARSFGCPFLSAFLLVIRRGRGVAMLHTKLDPSAIALQIVLLDECAMVWCTRVYHWRSARRREWGFISLRESELINRARTVASRLHQVVATSIEPVPWSSEDPGERLSTWKSARASSEG